MLKNYLLILLTILISIVGQTLLKAGMNGIGRIEAVELSTVIPLILRGGTNIFIIAGLTLFVIGTFFWLVLLSRLDISFLYPFGALQYLFIFLISYLFLGEEIRMGRIIGVLIILAGIFVISK